MNILTTIKNGLSATINVTITVISSVALVLPGVIYAGNSSGIMIDNVTLENPLKNINSIQALLVAILNIVEILMIPVIVFFIILAGFKYVTAQGNSTKVEEATRALTYAVIGGVLVLAAVAISTIIQTTVAGFTTTP